MSVAIMSLLLITVGAIFAMSTKATTLANANNEVLNSLRALEQQIRQDFRGIRKDAFLGLCYNYLPPRQVAPGRPETAAVRSDAVVFFANGDFQTIAKGQWWDPVAQTLNTVNAVPVKSNLARIEYGMLGVLDFSTADQTNSTRPLAQVELGRLAKLMISDLYPGTSAAQLAENPLKLADAQNDNDDAGMTMYNAFKAASGKSLQGRLDTDIYENWEYEYMTMADWGDPITWPAGDLLNLTVPSYATRLVGKYTPGATTRNNLWLGLPYIDVAQALADHVRMIPGCVSFKIQRWAETDPVSGGANWIPRWWPETIAGYDGSGNAVYENNDNDADLTSTPAFPLPTGQFTNDRRVWECFNAPPQLETTSPPGYYLNQTNPADWPQQMTDAQTWPWVCRDFSNTGSTTPPDLRRAIRADFPKALKITISVLDARRRAMDKVPASNRTYNDLELQAIGAQTFTMVIPLE